MTTRPPMTEARAKEILGDRADENGLDNNRSPEYLTWDSDKETAVLDGSFTIDEIEAIAWWMVNKFNPTPRS